MGDSVYGAGPPQVSIGSGTDQIVLKGRDAITAAGWALPFLLFARALRMLTMVPIGIGGAVWMLVRWWLS